MVEFTDAELEEAHAKHYPAGAPAQHPVAAQPEPQLGQLDQPQPPADYWPPARTARSPNLVRIPAGSEMVRCKDPKCPIQRLWIVKHPKTGKPTRVACEETVTLSDGVVVSTGAFPPYLNAAPGHDTLHMDGLGYSHFIDCPSRREFRRK